ncbi:glycosyltransferase [Bifidobacterium apri]|uniref:glycosyltransferase n=1 Tax=Bifidobacterium apri TaxID=1769423 RepID=UPI0039955CFA
MATYNGEKYLREQLDSVVNQDGVDVSILVRDDGSSDNTCSILEEYSKAHRLTWYADQHLNVAKGYFALMQKASETDFEYFAFCDQDDVWDKDKLSIALHNISEIKGPALYYCGQRLVDGDLNIIAEHELNRERSLHTRFVLSDFAGCTGVFNRSLLEEVVSYTPDYMLMHDTWILKVCLGVGGTVIVDPKAHMSYRQHEGNTVGLGRSIPSYIKQVRQYLKEYKVEPQMIELLRGYGDRMVPEYKYIARMCCIYKYDKKAKQYLLDKENINFCTSGLNLTFYIKVKFNIL